MKIINFKEVDNNIITIPETGKMYQLTETGMEILRLLKENKNIEEIKNIILEKYNIDKKQLEIDLEEYIRMLEIYGLIR